MGSRKVQDTQSIEGLRARVASLEDNRRHIQDALEMALSLADYTMDPNSEGAGQRLIEEAVQRINRIIPLDGFCVYLVDPESHEFRPFQCRPEGLGAELAADIENMIDEGFFAWAIRKRRSMHVPSGDNTRELLLHVIAQQNRVHGMFIGLLAGDYDALPQTSLTLLSITLLNLANGLASLEHLRYVENQNRLLEEKVAERTHKLKRSGEKLKKAAERQQNLAQEARQANQAKSRFLANMSHEIRTPLNGIIGCTEIMLNSSSLAQCHEMARTSLGASEHLLSLINNVLDYSKIEAGKIVLEHRAFDLHKLIDSVAGGLTVQASAKGISLHTAFSGAPHPHLVGDALRLRQVLINLVNNAIKFTRHGSVTLSVEKLAPPGSGKDQHLRFSVIDTGIGIAEDRQAGIFKRFTQADESTTRKYGGTGLGTTIAYQLVLLMGGRLELTSRPGRGSTFFFDLQLPLSSIEDVRSPETGPTESIRKDKDRCMPRPSRILLAEDTPVNQIVISKHLESQGHTVWLADNGRLAVEACRTQGFDLVLMDIQMPEMDGFEAARQILAEGLSPETTPIVALTANSDPQTRSRCIQSGMQAVLTKPIRREALLHAVARWLPPGRDQECTGEGPTPRLPAGPAEDETPLDLDTAVYEFGDLDMVRQVVGQLLDSAAAQIAEINRAMSDKDLHAMKQNAHALKGSAATVEAGPLAEAAAAVEDMCQNGSAPEMEPAVVQLQTRFDQLRHYIQGLDWA